MDRNKLIQILHKQAEPMDTAVQKKLAYLQGNSFYKQDEDDEDNTSFTDLLLAEKNAANRRSALPQQPLQRQRRAEPADTAQKLAMHKQTVAEKIAALRGISTMPGEYLSRRY